jgi:cysteine desulfurase
VLLELERRGILSSSGSACAAGSDAPSHVLVAMGVDPVVAQTAVRFSFAHETTREQLREVAEALPDAVAAVRGIR